MRLRIVLCFALAGFALAGCASRIPPDIQAYRHAPYERISGTSMLPLIHDGQRCLVDGIAYNRIQRGQDVSFYSPFYCEYVTHRVVGGVPGHWITQGINNPRPDPGYVDAANYVATVIVIFPK